MLAHNLKCLDLFGSYIYAYYSCFILAHTTCVCLSGSARVCVRACMYNKVCLRIILQRIHILFRLRIDFDVKLG